MTTSKTLFERASAWLRKPLIVCGLVAGLSFGVAPAAHANAWSFSYSGSGISASGVIYGAWNAVYGVWNITGISGTHNDGSGAQSITGLWAQPPANNGDNNYLAGATFGAPAPPPPYGGFYPDQMDLHFAVGSTNYAFGWYTYSGPLATEGPLSNLDWTAGGPEVITSTGRCIVGQDGCALIDQVQVAQVPEINASAGLEALALLFVFGLIMREMFLRRRNNASLIA